MNINNAKLADQKSAITMFQLFIDIIRILI